MISSNSLASNGRQALIAVNDGPIYWQICGSPGLNVVYVCHFAISQKTQFPAQSELDIIDILQLSIYR